MHVINLTFTKEELLIFISEYARYKANYTLHQEYFGTRGRISGPLQERRDLQPQF